jgi:poly-gamma-glutamate capsule biosynthesis protein CapA/YwtB (metallophosphatase superfamily)
MTTLPRYAWKSAVATFFAFLTWTPAVATLAPLATFGCEAEESARAMEPPKREDTLRAATIAAVGDLMCHSGQYNYAQVGPDTFDFAPFYEAVEPYFGQADFVMGNLETTLTGAAAGYSGFPRFNSPDEYATALKWAGFDFVTTSNNHSLDRGEKGVLRTIERLNLEGIGYVGTYVDQRDRDSVRIYDINGIEVAFLSYTFSTNGIPIPRGKPHLVNMIEPETIKADIDAARALDPDLVLVYYHFGTEYQQEPNGYQRSIVNKTIEFGADVILGGHPHSLQPMEYYATNGGSLDTGVVAYSLGNFISNQRWRYSDAGVVLYLEFTKDVKNDSIWISDVSFLPTWVFKGRVEGDSRYVPVPAQAGYHDDMYPFLSSGDRSKMRQAFDDTKEILTNYESRFNVRGLAIEEPETPRPEPLRDRRDFSLGAKGAAAR